MNNPLIAGLLIASSILTLQACVPVVVAGVASGAVATIDRRSFATQAEDETIEWKASARISERFGEKVHINATSFNRKLLLTGEVPSEEIKAEVERLVTNIPNVQGIHNEVAIAGITTFSARSNDAYITSKVKSRFVDANSFNPFRVKVITEGGNVYLMGLLTQREADAAVWITRTTAGVQKVVKLMEVISDAKARELDNEPRHKATPAETSEPNAAQMTRT